MPWSVGGHSNGGGAGVAAPRGARSAGAAAAERGRRWQAGRPQGGHLQSQTSNLYIMHGIPPVHTELVLRIFGRGVSLIIRGMLGNAHRNWQIAQKEGSKFPVMNHSASSSGRRPSICSLRWVSDISRQPERGCRRALSDSLSSAGNRPIYYATARDAGAGLRS